MTIDRQAGPCARAAHSPAEARLADVSGGLPGRALSRQLARPAELTVATAASMPERTGTLTEINPGERSLATYLLARALVGRAVQPADVRRLRAANTTVNQTRQLLSLGRGNVDVDVRASDQQSLWRTRAARAFKSELNQREPGPVVPNDTRVINLAASALTFGAGNCAEHASASSLFHTRRLQADERSHYVGSVAGHEWAESRLEATGGHAGRDRVVVIDAWSRGPAALASDTRFAKHEGGLWDVANFDVQTGLDARIATQERVLEARSRGQPFIEQQVRATITPTGRFAAFVDSVLPHGWGYWAEQHVLDDSFMESARSELEQAAGRSRALDLGEGVAKQLGVGDDHVKSQSGRIVDELSRLLANAGDS